MTTNKTVLKWLDEMKELLTPDQVVWVDGSEEQIEAFRAEACKIGELHKLNQEKLPGCYLHRTNPNDVARVEDRTFICTTTKEEAGPTNNCVTLPKCIKSFTTLLVAVTKAKQCTLFHTQWDQSVHQLPRLVLK